MFTGIHDGSLMPTPESPVKKDLSLIASDGENRVYGEFFHEFVGPQIGEMVNEKDIDGLLMMLRAHLSSLSTDGPTLKAIDMYKNALEDLELTPEDIATRLRQLEQEETANAVRNYRSEL